MRYLLFVQVLFLSVVFVSCSSVDYMSQENHDDVPNWIYDQGIIGDRLVAVGEAEGSFAGNHIYVKRNAINDAKGKLLEGAPGDFKSVAIRAMDEVAGKGKISFSKLDRMIQELRGVTGFEVNAKKVECVRATRNTEMGTRRLLICYATVSIKVNKLIEAYAYTLEKKYGVKDDGRFKSLVQKEMGRLMSH